MKKLLLAGIAAAAFCSAPVLADNTPPKDATYQNADPLFDWSGFYLGLNAGGIWGRTNQPIPDVFMDIHGGLIGGTAGYNWQSGNRVFGIEGDYDWAHLKETQFVSCGTGCTSDFKNFGTVRARLGYANGAYLVYATAGAAFTSARVFSGNGVISGKRDGTTGWTVGAGIEGMFAGNWSWKVEYLYAHFGKFAVAESDAFIDDTNLNIVRVGINYRFATGNGPTGRKY
jgi:outer membrane immunogenic protein